MKFNALLSVVLFASSIAQASPARSTQISVSVTAYAGSSPSRVMESVQDQLIEEAVRHCGSVENIESLADIKIGKITGIDGASPLSAKVSGHGWSGVLLLQDYAKVNASAVANCRR